MSKASCLYRKLVRLREKRKRLAVRISALERKLGGKTYRWGSCSCKGNRK